MSFVYLDQGLKRTNLVKVGKRDLISYHKCIALCAIFSPMNWTQPSSGLDDVQYFNMNQVLWYACIWLLVNKLGRITQINLQA